MGDNSDLRDCLDGLLIDLRRLAASPAPWPSEGVDRCTTRMASFIVAAEAPAANDVAKAVAADPSRFGRRAGHGPQLGLGGGESEGVELDRGVRIDRRTMRGL